jgi:protein disulfide-isomerase
MRTATPKLLVMIAVSLMTSHVARAEISWESDLRTAHQKAAAENKLLLLHFYSDNCIWCDRLEAGAFKKPNVGEAISRDYVALKVHTTKSPKLASLFKVTKFPTDVIVTTEGQTLAHKVSPQQSERYIAMLTECVASKPVAQVAEKVEPAPLNSSPTATPASTPQPDPTLPVSPNNDLSENSRSRLNNGVQATLAGSRGPSMTLPNQTTTGAFAERSGDLNASYEAAPVTPPLGLPNTQLSLPSRAETAAPTTNNLESGTTATEATATAATATAVTAQGNPAQGNPAQGNPAPTAIAKPDLAMQGFCAVTVINENRWIEGKSEYGVIHLGKLYLFSSQQAMGSFLADPAPFTPVLNEIDVVRFFEERKIVKGKREFGVLDPIHNRMFFFADEAALKHFENEYERYTDAALEVMATAIKEANLGT